MRLTLGSRFALIFAGSLAATALALFVVLYALATQQSERQAQMAVQSASQMLTRLMRYQAHTLQAQSELISQSKGIGPLIVAGDRTTIDDYLQDWRKTLGVAGVVLLDPHASLLGTSDPRRYKEITPALTSLPSSAPWNGIVIQSDRPQLALWTPITDPASQQPQGVLVVFRALDNLLARDLADTIGAQVTFTWHGRIVAASHPADSDPGFVSEVPLATASTDGALLLTVRLPRESLLAAFDRQRTAVLMVCIVALGVGLIAASRLSHTLTEPVEAVIAAARTLRGGSWPDPIPVRRSDELGMLQTVFNEMTASLHESQVVAIQALAATVDARDAYTAGHSHRVAEVAGRLADALGLPPEQVERIVVAATLHDIGKLAIPDAILLKAESLLPLERAIMESHAVRSEEIVAKVPPLAPTLPAIRHHHERWDGGGYPDRLAGEAIPLDARILALADTFDALTTDRPYRRGLAPGYALAEIARCSGTQFDPDLVPAFVALWADVERVEIAPIRKAA